MTKFCRAGFSLHQNNVKVEKLVGKETELMVYFETERTEFILLGL